MKVTDIGQKMFQNIEKYREKYPLEFNSLDTRVKLSQITENWKNLNVITNQFQINCIFVNSKYSSNFSKINIYGLCNDDKFHHFEFIYLHKDNQNNSKDIIFKWNSIVLPHNESLKESIISSIKNILNLEFYPTGYFFKFQF